jgi:hypothetical protein
MKTDPNETGIGKGRRASWPPPCCGNGDGFRIVPPAAQSFLQAPCRSCRAPPDEAERAKARMLAGRKPDHPAPQVAQGPAEGREPGEMLPQVLPQQKYGSIIMRGNWCNLLILMVGGDGLEPPTLSV